MTPQITSFRTNTDKKKEINRRQSIRYVMNAPMQYRAICEGKAGLPYKGQVLDMSAGGLRAGINSTVEAGAMLEISMDWPGIYHGKPKMRLMLLGEVLRVNESSAALRIVRHEFRSPAVRIHPAAPERRLAVA